MRWTTLGAGLVLIGGLVWNGVSAAAPAVGEEAPAFSGMATNGETVTLESLRGKTVVLEWTNHQCPFVRKHYESGNMQKTQAAATAEGTVWVSIIYSAPGKQGFVSAEEATELTKSRAASPSYVVLDPEGTIGRAYEARTTPHMFVIDPEGKLVYMGGIDDKPTSDQADIAAATNYVTAALADMNAGKPVATPVSEPYGCSVKYAE
ncbi:MAG: redoxin domain-containing protein [Alphaproteobacteria bacterium]|nr:redoxin domain-containing protein [Alphaproteobacteria bacterium]